MRSLATGLCAAFALYSAIPVPQVRWDPDGRNLRHALCGLPLVGVVAGALLIGWGALAGLLGAEPLFFAAVATLIPVGVSGGIHMDGWMDVCDALGSHAQPARRLEIMKDPRAGAFAVLGCGAYLLLNAGLWAQLWALGRPALLAIPAAGMVVSRALDALSIATFPCARSSGLARLFADAAAKRPVAVCCALFALAGTALCIRVHPLGGLLALALSALYFPLHRILCLRGFGGNTGDLAGFLLQMTELLFLLAAVIGGLVG